MRHKRLGVESVLPVAARDSSGKNVSREAISSAGRIWDRAEPTVGPVHQVGSATRERADLNPKVFRNEVARAIGKLWRQDDKSRNSARSAIPWVWKVKNCCITTPVTNSRTAWLSFEFADEIKMLTIF